jgi:hypothetical protein
MKMKRTFALILAAAAFAFSGCVYNGRPDWDQNRPDNRAEARRACVELARDRGFRQVDVDSVEREGRGEWRVMMSATDRGRDQRLRCDYEDRGNRARLTQLTR